ncbi:replication initiation protein RepC [Leisingera sp. M658]|uniref:replication initiation protein RepC n=1 Tax=Leisingera sp. M658 TaxID=2867015 RepID=UPI0021A541F1|nr:replication initiation protein RepC [Leisingera sp. M658]UWQ77477.1 hypothetical protein K3724_23120 [Leisingera sp. M658]
MNEQYYPALPQGWQRSHVEELLDDIAPAIGLGAKRLKALRHMMKRTRPSDWTSNATEPVYFGTQADTAYALGKTERALRNDEYILEAVHGLIEKRVKANGSRSFYGQCGIIFSRLIDLVPSLIELRERLMANHARMRELVQLRSTYLRHMKRQIEAASPELARSTDYWAVTETFSQWPHSSKLRSMGLDDLEAHVSDCRKLCGQIDSLIETCEDSSCQAEENFRSLLQENTKDSSVKCNAGIHKRTSGKPSDTTLCDTGPAGPVNCLESKHVVSPEVFKSRFLGTLSPQKLFDLASEDMKLHIQAHQGARDRVRMLDIIEAAQDLKPYLGINHSAWVAAAHAMGPEQAAVCVLIIDANRNHPTHPVRNPGGALRAMLKQFRREKLNLVGSLIGLSRRCGS